MKVTSIFTQGFHISYVITQGSHLSSDEVLRVFLTEGTFGKTSLLLGVCFLGPLRLRLKIIKYSVSMFLLKRALSEMGQHQLES
jgi:hypothetical protein